MPPPPLPDSFAVLPPHAGWGTWHLEQADDGEEDDGHGHGHHDAVAVAAHLEPADDGEEDHGHGHHAAATDDPFGFLGFPAPEPSDAPVILAEAGEREQLEWEDGEEEGDQEDESVYIPHYDFNLLIQPEEEADPDMPPLIDDADFFDERPIATTGPIAIRGLDDIFFIRSNPVKYSQSSGFIIVSFRFGHTLDLLHAIRMTHQEQHWDWIGNFKHLLQAAQLAETFGQLDKRLSCLSRSLQEHILDKDMIQSLLSLLPQLVENRTSLQPSFIRYYANAITTALKFLSARVTAVSCLINYEDLESSVQYMLERIEALDKEGVNYRDDVLPQEQPMPLFPFNDLEEDGEEQEDEEEEEVEEDEENYMYDLRFLLQAEDEKDAEMPQTVSDCDSEDDDSLDQFVLIRGLIGLEHIKSAPQRYSRSSYYIIQSFCFGDVWDLLHGIREISKLQGWLWVGNLELVRQVHSIRDSFALLHRDLNRLLRDQYFDRELVSSLERFRQELDFTRTSMQPPNVRYSVDSIAVALQALLAMLRDELSAESHARPRRFTDIDARARVIIQRMDKMDNELVKYSQQVFPPEILPALPGYPPIPLATPDTSPLPSPENSPKCAATAPDSP